MNKVIIVGERGNQTSTRDEDTQDAINLYCKIKNTTEKEINEKGLSIYTVEFNSNNSPYVHLINKKDEWNN